MTVLLAILSVAIEALYLLMLRNGDVRHHVESTMVLLVVLSLFYLVSVYLILEISKGPVRPTRLVLIACAAVIFRLTAWPLYPGFSDDAFRYRWEGKIQALGGNPYQAAPNDPQWAGARDATFPSVVGKDRKAGYGPLTEIVEDVSYRAIRRAVDDPFAQVFWFKLPGALFDLSVCAALAWLLALRGLRMERALIYAWCPLPIFEFWAQGHNDSLTILFILLALCSAVRGRTAWTFAALWMAVAAKLWPLILFPLFLFRREHGLRKRAAWAAATAPLFLLCWWPHRSNVIENLRFMSGFIGGWRNNDSVFGALLWLAHGDLDHAKDSAFLLLALAVAFVAWKRWPLERACLVVVVALLGISANCFPWYLTWFVPLLAVLPWTPLLLWTALMPLTYTVLFDWVAVGVWNGVGAIRWYVYVPVILFALLNGCVLSAAPSIEAGYRQMYNLQFDAAHRTFADWQRVHPQDPLGPASDAAAYLFAEFERLHILEAEFFTDDRNFKKARELTADAGTKRAFEAALAKTDQLVGAATDDNARFAQVLSLGLRADYAALIEKRNLASLAYTKRGRLLAEQLVAHNPGAYDAYLAIGVENYLLSLKSAPLRWALRMYGAETDKARGIAELKNCAEHGHLLQPFARLLLAVAALRDKDRQTARSLLQGLAREFPLNHLYARELERIR